MKNKNTKISIVIPCYCCSKSLEELYKRLRISLAKVVENDYEIIMVNDASPENDWEIIKKLASQKNSHLIGINLSRNFGQHYAITAGLDYVSGKWTVVMDGDLQDQPEEIEKMYKKALEGYDVVVGRRIERKDSFLKVLGSRLFYLVYNYLSGVEINSQIGNFGLYHRKVINAVLRMKEQNRSFGLFVLWSGFKRVEIDIEHAQRPAGKSSYSLRKLFKLAFDSIIAHSNKLLKLTVKLGLLISFISFLYVLWLVFKYFFWETPLLGWTSVIASVYLLGGIVLSAIGVVGIYIGKIFDEVKNRPLYLISEIINC